MLNTRFLFLFALFANETDAQLVVPRFAKAISHYYTDWKLPNSIFNHLRPVCQTLGSKNNSLVILRSLIYHKTWNFSALQCSSMRQIFSFSSMFQAFNKTFAFLFCYECKFIYLRFSKSSFAYQSTALLSNTSFEQHTLPKAWKASNINTSSYSTCLGRKEAKFCCDSYFYKKSSLRSS